VQQAERYAGVGGVNQSTLAFDQNNASRPNDLLAA
jgi:hypothetical protein